MPVALQPPAPSVPERGIAGFLVPEETSLSAVEQGLPSGQAGPDQHPVRVYLEQLPLF